MTMRIVGINQTRHESYSLWEGWSGTANVKGALSYG